MDLQLVISIMAIVVQVTTVSVYLLKAYRVWGAAPLVRPVRRLASLAFNTTFIWIVVCVLLMGPIIYVEMGPTGLVMRERLADRVLRLAYGWGVEFLFIMPILFLLGLLVRLPHVGHLRLGITLGFAICATYSAYLFAGGAGNDLFIGPGGGLVIASLLGAGVGALVGSHLAFGLDRWTKQQSYDFVIAGLLCAAAGAGSVALGLWLGGIRAQMLEQYYLSISGNPFHGDVASMLVILGTGYAAGLIILCVLWLRRKPQ